MCSYIDFPLSINLVILKRVFVSVIAVRQVTLAKYACPYADDGGYFFNSHLINAYLANRSPYSKCLSLKDMIEFNQLHADKTLKYGQTILLEAELTPGTLTETQYVQDRMKDALLSKDQGIDWAINQFQLDALLFPGDRGAMISGRAGYPSITVPADYTNAGIPWGITFTGKACTESKLIQFAFAFEQSSKERRPPLLMNNNT
jgi:amidase